MKNSLIIKAKKQIEENNKNMEFIKGKKWGKDSIIFYKDYNRVLRIVINKNITEYEKIVKVEEFCQKYGYFDSSRFDVYFD